MQILSDSIHLSLALYTQGWRGKIGTKYLSMHIDSNLVSIMQTLTDVQIEGSTTCLPQPNYSSTFSMDANTLFTSW